MTTQGTDDLRGEAAEEGRTASGERRLELSSPRSADAGLRRLDNILRALPESELKALVGRMGIRVDDQKRIDVASQVARALVGVPEVRDPSRLPAQAQELLHRVAESRGVLRVPALPSGIEPLMARGILFARRLPQSERVDGLSIELVLPTAYLVQLPSWQNEDPRALRALLAQAPFETVSAIASHYLGRPATPPIALALETAWESLVDPEVLAAEVERLPPVERKLLEAIESGGGEVDTPELLDLEREPMRLRGAKGVSASRRGAGFALERRALLIPIHPNRHVVPSEVAAIVGAERKRHSESRRNNIRAHVLGGDHAPRRARFARDPSGLSLAIAIASREMASEIRPNVGTPRSLILRLAQRFGRTNAAISLLSSLSRATGLWEPSALSPAAPPGSLRVGEIGTALFATWRRGGAWDEARPEPEVMRAAPDQRDASPSRALREIVIEALSELGEDSWLPWTALEGYLIADPRLESTERLFKRWAERAGITAAPQPIDVARKMVLESLPTLGVVDIGAETDVLLERSSGSSDAFDPQIVPTLTLRITPRGRGYLATPPAEATLAFQGGPALGKGFDGRSSDVVSRRPTAGAADGEARSAARVYTPSRFSDSHVLHVGTAANTAAVLALGFHAEIGRVEDSLDFVLSPSAIARSISGGALGDEIRERIEAVAPLPDGLSQTLTQASAVIGKATFAASSGFLWVDDPDVREMLRSRKATADLFVDPSPPGGLLIAGEVDLEKLARRCRALGVEVEGVSRGGLRAGATTSTRPSVAGPSQRPPSSRGRSPTPPPRSRTPFPRGR